MSKTISNKDFLGSVKTLIQEAQKYIVRNVNFIMLITYYEIGRMIVEEEQNGRDRAEYGKEIIKNLSLELNKEFNIGYSVDNLQNMRRFYLTYSKYETVSRILGQGQIYETLSSKSEEFPFKLSWSHYISLMKIKNEEERSFYEIEAWHNSWSLKEMERQVNSALFERLALSRDKDGVKQLAQKGHIIEKPLDALKEPYVLEFLELKEDNRYSESELETEIINKLEHFMMELGKGFLFGGRQKRFTMEGQHFYVDLVFYNRLLKCFVLIDLKLGELTHQDIGQMQMYVNYYDRVIKTNDENNTIGIILCKKDNKTVVEFTLPEGNSQIFSREYSLYLPSKEDLKKQLE
jgi:predicted nuclease of restriction endonuclease-like (RecB) superfamily